MKKSNLFAFFLLAVMALLLLGSVWNDSATMDELAHIPAGYSYVTLRDFRLNPEHPPLLKALSGFSTWLFVRPHFPTDTVFWQNDLNGQWAQGAKFLYESGNNADRIIFWSRIPIMLLAIFFGFILFLWAKKRFGAPAALLTLTFFVFSPTMLAHSRYVTTDLGAAFGFFIGIASFIEFLERPSKKYIILAGTLLGTALLLKFSLVLLLPIYLILFAAWIIAQPRAHLHDWLAAAGKLLIKMVLVGGIALFTVWLTYALFTQNYPQARQLHDTEALLGSYGFRQAVDFDLFLVKNRLTRPLGHYLLGVLMVQQRAAGGNTAFFLGEVSSAGSRAYFPILYLLKEPLALHLLALIALAIGIRKIKRDNSPIFDRIRAWTKNHFAEATLMVFIAFYWIFSMRSPLNIGLRHLLPTFPFIYLLISRQLSEWLHAHAQTNPRSWFEWFRNVYQIYIKAIPKLLLVLALMLWFAGSSLLAFPHFLSYYNELAGGTRNGYVIAVDSNYDWGQDLKRLRDFVQARRIEKIALDYFGGGSPSYYLGSRFEPWWSAKGPASGWFAISATFQQGAFGATVPGFIRKPEDSYAWLKPYQPVARAGHSLFIYHLP